MVIFRSAQQSWQLELTARHKAILIQHVVKIVLKHDQLPFFPPFNERFQKPTFLARSIIYTSAHTPQRLSLPPETGRAFSSMKEIEFNILLVI